MNEVRHDINEERISFINCTPHKVNVMTPTGELISFPKTNIVVRMMNINHETRYINNKLPVTFIEELDELPQNYKGKLPTKLPPPCKNVVYIVSSIVFERSLRLDIVKPDASKYTLENGEKAVSRLIAKYDFNNPLIN